MKVVDGGDVIRPFAAVVVGPVSPGVIALEIVMLETPMEDDTEIEVKMLIEKSAELVLPAVKADEVLRILIDNETGMELRI